MLVVLVCGCPEPKPPAPVIVPPVAAVPDAGVVAGAPEPEPEPEPVSPEPDVVSDFPEDERAALDAQHDEALRRLLMIDASAAEAELTLMETPDAFRIALLAELARARGGKQGDVAPEPLLPLDAGAPVVAGAAWTVADAVPLTTTDATSKGLVLPFNTQVQVLSLEQRQATIEVSLADVVTYDATGGAPRSVKAVAVKGTVPLSSLSPVALVAAALEAEASRQPDDEAGQLRAIALRQRVWRIERSRRAREALLESGWKAKRASTVVLAALAHDLAPVKDLKVAAWCGADAPPSTKWLTGDVTRLARVGASECVAAFDARRACERDAKKEAKRRTGVTSWVQAHAADPRGSWLRFVVDGRTPRRLFLVETPLAVADPCNDFEEVTFDASQGRVRRLAFPLGRAALEVWVPVQAQLGVEYALVSAASEPQAVEWLRSRAKYRWTVGARGALQPSLGTDATGFAVSQDVDALTFALAPERSCGCPEVAPE
jgi:hypothetical protein